VVPAPFGVFAGHTELAPQTALFSHGPLALSQTRPIWKVVAGQAAFVPSQNSSFSHRVAAVWHIVPAGDFRSVGHVPAVPSHTSCGSQAPPDA
jgi:hypothetical protein